MKGSFHFGRKHKNPSELSKGCETSSLNCHCQPAVGSSCRRLALGYPGVKWGDADSPACALVPPPTRTQETLSQSQPAGPSVLLSYDLIHPRNFPLWFKCNQCFNVFVLQPLSIESLLGPHLVSQFQRSPASECPQKAAGEMSTGRLTFLSKRRLCT